MPRQLVGSEAVVDHIAELIDVGWTQTEIARATGLSKAVVWKASRPGYQLDTRTAEQILSLSVYPSAARRSYQRPSRAIIVCPSLVHGGPGPLCGSGRVGGGSASVTWRT